MAKTSVVQKPTLTITWMMTTTTAPMVSPIVANSRIFAIVTPNAAQAGTIHRSSFSSRHQTRK